MKQLVILLILGGIAGYFHIFSFLNQTFLVTDLLRHEFEICDANPLVQPFESSERFSCFRKSIVAIVKRYGLRIGVEVVKEYAATENGTYLQGQRCHALAHEVGNAAARMGVPSEALMKDCVGMCVDSQSATTVTGMDLGCLNGAAHTWVLLQPDIRLVSKKCAIQGVSDDVADGCYHGLGHGLSELYGDDIKKEIQECEKIPVAHGRYQCAHAVFMEKTALFTTSKNIVFDPVSYCQTLPKEIKDSCDEFTGFLVYSQKRDVNNAFDSCKFAADFIRPQCLNRIGEAVYKSTLSADAILGCMNALSYTDKKLCVTGFVRASIDTVNDAFGATALAACQSLPEEFRQVCFGDAGKILQLRYGAGIRVLACNTIRTDEARLACISSL